MTGVFPVQQEKLKTAIIRRRGLGKACSTVWIGNKMFHICKDDMPEGFDPSNLNQFGKRWVNRFMDSHDMSIRHKTNKKQTSVFERMHKIQGYRWYTIYQMAFAEISDEEEESTSSEMSSYSVESTSEESSSNEDSSSSETSSSSEKSETSSETSS